MFLFLFDSDTYMASPKNGVKIDLCGQKWSGKFNYITSDLRET